MEAIKVERAEIEDYLAIAALDRVAWRQHRDGDFIPDGDHVWRQWCEHAYVYVARMDGGVENSNSAIVGAVLAFRCLSETFCLHKAIVGFEHRGKGIGSLLFKALLAELDRGGHSCFLTVDPVNEAAKKLYLKWGFESSEIQYDYYGPGKNRLVMTRPAHSGNEN